MLDIASKLGISAGLSWDVTTMDSNTVAAIKAGIQEGNEEIQARVAILLMEQNYSIPEKLSVSIIKTDRLGW